MYWVKYPLLINTNKFMKESIPQKADLNVFSWKKEVDQAFTYISKFYKTSISAVYFT